MPLTDGSNNKIEYANLNDGVLLNFIEKSDEKAYQELLNRYLQPLWRLASNVLHDPSEAEDVIQDVFLNLWHKKLAWDAQGSAKFTSWIYRVVINKCIDIKRKKQRSISNPEKTLHHAKDVRENSEEMVVRKQKTRTIKDALNELPDNQAQAMRLFYYEEESLETIANTMSTSINAVKSLLKRGRKRVKEILS